MDQHYSAFISYKHAPADTAVASEIQKTAGTLSCSGGDPEKDRQGFDRPDLPG